MRALVVYESMFGNTRIVAQEVAKGLADRWDTDLVEVDTAPAAIGPDVELLLVGGPTHALGMSRPGTRRDAASQAEGPLVSPGRGIREWLATVTADGDDHAFAAFDTRVRPRWLPGSAARAAARALRRAGLREVARPETFWVAGTRGPLVDGEAARARSWAHSIGVSVLASPSRTARS